MPDELRNMFGSYHLTLLIVEIDVLRVLFSLETGWWFPLTSISFKEFELPSSDDHQVKKTMAWNHIQNDLPPQRNGWLNTRNNRICEPLDAPVGVPIPILHGEIGLKVNGRKRISTHLQEFSMIEYNFFFYCFKGFHPTNRMMTVIDFQQKQHSGTETTNQPGNGNGRHHGQGMAES